MKKIQFSLIPLCLFTILLMIISCKKDLNNLEPTLTSETQSLAKRQVIRAVRDTFNGVVRFIPDFASGGSWADFALAWWPLEAEGYSTILPIPAIGQASSSHKVRTFSNSYTIRNAQGVVMTYGRSVKQFFAKQLQELNIQVPDDVHTVSFDDKGNSVWGQVQPEGWPSWWADAQHIALGGKIIIVGGTGKYAGASGENDFHAQFESTPFEANKIHLTMSEQGWIKY